MANGESEVVFFAVFIVLGLVASAACLISNFLRMNRTHQWYQQHMPLLPNSANLRLDAALRDAEEGFNACQSCGFENLKRNIFCTICGTPVECPEGEEEAKHVKKQKKRAAKDKGRTSVQLNRRRHQRALKRKEWVRKLDVEGKLYWYRDGSVSGVDPRFPGYVLQFQGDAPVVVEPVVAENVDASKVEQPEDEPREAPLLAPEVVSPVAALAASDAAVAAATDRELRGSVVTTDIEASGANDGEDEGAADDELTDEQRAEALRKAKELELNLSTVEETNARLWKELESRELRLLESTEVDPARPAIVDAGDAELLNDTKVLAEHAQLDFPTKIAEFVTRTATVLVPAEQSFLKLKIRRYCVLADSIETLASTPEKFSRCVIRMSFVGEQGVDAGGVYREWLVMINEKIISRKAGIFRCVDNQDKTFHLNPHSRRDIGEHHLAHFFATGRLLGRALLEGNVTGFHLSLPLLKIILGQPVSFTDLEYFDPEAYKSMVWLLENDGVGALGLDFSVTEKLANGEVVVVDLIPGGRNIDVTDENKLEYVDRKLRYLVFGSVSDQLFAFLKGLHEVIPQELLMLFDAEELDYVLSGSDEIDVHDWERNSKYTADLIEHPVREWFWELVREMPNEYRRRLLQFSTGSSRVPLAGFMALTSYDGRLCPFTLKGVDIEEKGGYIRSHACFNRLDLPRYQSKTNLKTVLYAVLDTELYGFTTD